jgi:4-hydroxy-tetrahydrodipicolinate synthase
MIVQTAPISGAMTALITPFRDGAVDLPALRRLVDIQIDNGISALIPCGTTGETPSLTEREADLVIATVVETTNGRVPVIAGTGSNGTHVAIERTRRARELGADAALVVTPYYNKPTQDGLFAHFTAIADGADLPIVLYNVPGRTGVNMLPETILRLAEHHRIIAVKEASGSIDQSSQITVSAPATFAVLSGDDSLTLPIMSVGGTGVVSVLSNILPAPVAALAAAAAAGDYAEARRIHLDLFDLCRAMFCETNPVPVKAAAAMLGLCSDEVRLPLAPLSEASRRRVELALDACPWVPGRTIAA